MRRKFLLGIAILAAAVCALALGLYLGAAGQRMSATIGLVLEDSEDGPRVLAVEENSPADRAGIRPGDRVTGVGGDPVSSEKELKQRLQGEEPHSLTVDRHGSEVQIQLSSPAGLAK